MRLKGFGEKKFVTCIEISLLYHGGTEESHKKNFVKIVGIPFDIRTGTKLGNRRLRL